MKNRHISASCCVLAILVLGASWAQASGHGPVFTLATPTNAKGGWALDFGLMGRKGATETSGMFRGMLSYGITQDLQVSFSAPLVFETARLVPGRLTSMMPGNSDLEGVVAWRFHREGTDVGTRVESTAYGGIVIPGPQFESVFRNVRKSPGVWIAGATGFASRTHYLWGGAGYLRFGESKGDQRPDLIYDSAVWGYRPPPLQKEYPHWDWRLFVELTGERSGRLRRQGVQVAQTGGHQVFVGPTTLGIYKNYAIEGGIQFPVYRNVRAAHEEENFRFAINFSYFF